MNLFSSFLIVQSVIGAAFLWASRTSIPRGEPVPPELPVPDTIIWIRKGTYTGLLLAWSNYSSARDFMRGHPDWDIAIFALGEVLAFVTGFLVARFLTKETWPTGIAAVASVFSCFAFFWILIDAR